MGPADPQLREAITESVLPLPPSYKEFVLRFGTAKLYRNARNNSYRIGVFAGPREAKLPEGEIIYHIGFHDGAGVYVKAVRECGESPIFEYEQVESQVADTFEEWLSRSCAEARKQYSQKKWAEILKGPKPFTLQEEKIIQTRRRIHWKVLRIDSRGNHVFEVRNESDSLAPLLTVGIRSKDRSLNGAVRLSVEGLEPGKSTVLHVDCYKNLVSPDNIEVFPLPDPTPEDREYYYELSGC